MVSLMPLQGSYVLQALTLKDRNSFATSTIFRYRQPLHEPIPMQHLLFYEFVFSALPRRSSHVDC